MREFLARGIGLILALALCSGSCASAPKTPPIDRPAGLAVTRLADLRLPMGTECMVRLVSGETVRGELESISDTRLVLRSRATTGAITQLDFDHDDIALVARVVKMSKSARGWLGAAVGAIASLPLSISMIGDMMIPAAIVGGLIGSATGDSRAEVVFERPQALPPILPRPFREQR